MYLCLDMFINGIHLQTTISNVFHLMHSVNEIFICMYIVYVSIHNSQVYTCVSVDRGRSRGNAREFQVKLALNVESKNIMEEKDRQY